MAVWSSTYEERAWRESNCDRCFQPDEVAKRLAGRGSGCPLLIIATGGTVPEPWTKRRKADMGKTYRCDDYAKRPPVQRRNTAPPQTEALFDNLAPAEKLLVPVDGWPDYQASARRGGDDHQ